MDFCHCFNNSSESHFIFYVLRETFHNSAQKLMLPFFFFSFKANKRELDLASTRGNERLLERTTLNLCLLVNIKDYPKGNWEELLESWDQWPQYYKNIGPGFLCVARLGHQQPSIWQLLSQNKHVTEFSGQEEGPSFLPLLKSSYRHRGLADYWGFHTKGRKPRAAITWQSYKSRGATVTPWMPPSKGSVC